MEYNITHYKGTTYSASFEVVQNELPVDLTGYTIEMHVRTSRSAPTISLDLTDNINVTDAAGGEFEIEEVVINLPARVYYYDIRFTKDGVVNVWIEGKMTIEQNVTRDE